MALLCRLLASAVVATSASAESSFILVGKVVTMNAEATVLPRGVVLVRDGRIAQVAGELAQLGDAITGAPIHNTRGVIYPGLIDLHNHSEYAIYPLLPIARKYQDRYQWRFYDDEYATRITHLNELLTRPHYLDFSLEVGRYGEYKALVAGTTSLQGGRSGSAYARDERNGSVSRSSRAT